MAGNWLSCVEMDSVKGTCPVPRTPSTLEVMHKNTEHKAKLLLALMLHLCNLLMHLQCLVKAADGRKARQELSGTKQSARWLSCTQPTAC